MFAGKSVVGGSAVGAGYERDVGVADAELQLGAVGGVVMERLVDGAALPGDGLAVAAVEEKTVPSHS